MLDGTHGQRRYAIDALLSAALLLGLAKALAGNVAALFWLEDTLHLGNEAGIPRWLPHLVSLVLVGVTAATWNRTIAMRTLAAWWALAAGAFARPSLVGNGVWDPRIEILMAPLVFLLAFIGARRGVTLRVRIAVVSAALTPVAIAGALALPTHTAASQWADAAAYTTILAVAILSGRTAVQSRST